MAQGLPFHTGIAMQTVLLGPEPTPRCMIFLHTVITNQSELVPNKAYPHKRYNQISLQMEKTKAQKDKEFIMGLRSS